MALADEETRAAAWRTSRRNLAAATRSRAQALSGSASEYSELLDDWAGLVPTGNLVPIQELGSYPDSPGAGEQQPLPAPYGDERHE